MEAELGEDITDIVIGNPTDQVRLSVRLNAETFARLDLICLKFGRTFSEVVEAAILDYQPPLTDTYTRGAPVILYIKPVKGPFDLSA